MNANTTTNRLVGVINACLRQELMSCTQIQILDPATMSQPSTTTKEAPTTSEGPMSDTPSQSNGKLSIAGLKRSASNVLQSQQAQAGTRVLKAAGRTIVGAHPIWLMGEALTGRVSGRGRGGSTHAPRGVVGSYYLHFNRRLALSSRKGERNSLQLQRNCSTF